MHVRQMFNVETDISDWPLCTEVNGKSRPLPDECKGALAQHAKDVLRERGPLALHELYQALRRRAKNDDRCAHFNKAALLDWLYACIVRAARAGDCEERWHAPR